jgi:FkbM family methyltransferase
MKGNYHIASMQKGNRSSIFKGSDNDKESTRLKRHSDISRADYIISHINQLRSTTRNFFLIRKAYANYRNVVTAIRKNQYPVQVVIRRRNNTRDERRVLVSSLNELLLIAHLRDHKSLGYDPNKGLLTINLDIDSSSSFPYNSEGNKLTLDGCRNNGDVISVFIENEYSFLPVEEKTVIDIGANIADSTIYFCLKGAARVIALEPFPHNYVIAKKNIESNNLSAKVSLLLAGLGPNTENVSISTEYASNHESRARDFGEGIQIPTLTLADIIDKYMI